MALTLGPDLHSIRMSGEWGRWSRFLLPLAGKKLPPRCARAGPCGGRTRGRRPPPHRGSRDGGRESGPRRPSFFCSAPHPPVHSSRGGEGGSASPRGEGLEAPAPPRGAPHHHCPQRLGGGGCKAEAGPAPTVATPPASGAAPAVPGRIPTLAATTPLHKERPAGRGGGPAYRDVRNALLALVRHSPSGARGPAAGLAGCLSLVRLLSWSRSPRER